MGARDAAKTDLLPGTLDMLILRTLATRVQHGYGIAQHIRQLSDDVLNVEEGSLYPALQRLQVRGLIKSEWGHSANGRRARYYRLTPAGRKQLGIELSRFERLLKAITQVIHPSEAPS
jgi:transcriptional regulator